MSLVQVLQNWSNDFRRQTPGNSGRWEGVEFAFDEVPRADYVVVLTQPHRDTTVTCPPGRIWMVLQEPPNERCRRLHRGDKTADRVYMQDSALQGAKYFHSHPAVPWMVQRDYDYLTACKPAEKRGRLSWITSNLTMWQGHRTRMQFMEKIRERVSFDLYGRGFRSLDDKWDGLAPYQYSIAVENFANEHYWTEKIADCFLAWTMPVYCGCTRITDYFPAEAMVRFDMADPDAPRLIEEAAQSNRWEKNLDAIAHARELVLKRYQFCAFIAAQVSAEESRQGGTVAGNDRTVTITNEIRVPLTWRERVPHASRTMVRGVKRFAARVGTGSKLSASRS